MKRPEIIALYLPQFHPIPENDKWWGKGFTEWTNVKKSKPLFKGHDQPRIPTELGYYDLRNPEIRQKQADLAKLAGVTSFCYWHYWFGNGKRLMADIYDEVLASGKPDFGFCLGWANHSWYSKTWNKDGTTSNNLLIGQLLAVLSPQRSECFGLRTRHQNRGNNQRTKDIPFAGLVGTGPQRLRRPLIR